MKAVDFSAKHNVMIRHKDGVMTTMDTPYYETTKIGENTWMILSSGDYHYLLAGEGEGIAIDTGYGAGNLRAYLEGLCGAPVRRVVNTHSHFDHCANNGYFDLAYMGKEALPLAGEPYPSFKGVVFPRDYEKKAVGDGDILPLAGRDLEIIRIGDHTQDGIAILDRRERRLFTGDEIMPGMKALRGTVEGWHRSLQRLLAHRDEFDTLWGGAGELDANLVAIYGEAAERILAGRPSDPAIEEGPRPQLCEEYDGEGRLVYDCHSPHPEDVPKGGFAKGDENRVDYFWKGFRFSYDRTMVRG